MQIRPPRTPVKVAANSGMKWGEIGRNESRMCQPDVFNIQTFKMVPNQNRDVLGYISCVAEAFAFTFR